MRTARTDDGLSMTVVGACPVTGDDLQRALRAARAGRLSDISPGFGSYTAIVRRPAVGGDSDDSRPWSSVISAAHPGCTPCRLRAGSCGRPRRALWRRWWVTVPIRCGWCWTSSPVGSIPAGGWLRFHASTAWTPEHCCGWGLRVRRGSAGTYPGSRYRGAGRSAVRRYAARGRGPAVRAVPAPGRRILQRSRLERDHGTRRAGRPGRGGADVDHAHRRP